MNATLGNCHIISFIILYNVVELTSSNDVSLDDALVTSLNDVILNVGFTRDKFFDNRDLLFGLASAHQRPLRQFVEHGREVLGVGIILG